MCDRQKQMCSSLSAASLSPKIPQGISPPHTPPDAWTQNTRRLLQRLQIRTPAFPHLRRKGGRDARLADARLAMRDRLDWNVVGADKIYRDMQARAHAVHLQTPGRPHMQIDPTLSNPGGPNKKKHNKAEIQNEGPERAMPTPMERQRHRQGRCRYQGHRRWLGAALVSSTDAMERGDMCIFEGRATFLCFFLVRRV